MITKEQVLESLKDIYDPEIPINIVDLGLIYSVVVGEDGVVDVEMTLTAPGCGIGPAIASQVEERISSVEGIQEANVELVFDPPWSPERMSDEAKAELGFG